MPDQASSGGTRLLDGVQDQGFCTLPVRPAAPHAARSLPGRRVDEQSRVVLVEDAGRRDVYPCLGLPQYSPVGPGAFRPALVVGRHEGGILGYGGTAEKTRVLRRVPSVARASLRSSPSRLKPASPATRALGRFSGSHRISTRWAPRTSKAKAAIPRTASVTYPRPVMPVRYQ